MARILPGEVKGHVKDAETRAGIEGAIITLNGNGSVRTRPNGSYIIASPLESGEHQLTAEADGYKPQIDKVKLYKGKITNKNFFLSKA